MKSIYYLMPHYCRHEQCGRGGLCSPHLIISHPTQYTRRFMPIAAIDTCSLELELDALIYILYFVLSPRKSYSPNRQQTITTSMPLLEPLRSSSLTLLFPPVHPESLCTTSTECNKLLKAGVAVPAANVWFCPP